MTSEEIIQRVATVDPFDKHYGQCLDCWGTDQRIGGSGHTETCVFKAAQEYIRNSPTKTA